MTQVNTVDLRKALTTYFNEGELRTLCFDLGISYDDLGGRGKAANAAELVTYAQRHNLLDKLAYSVQTARPHVKLRSAPAANEPPPGDDAPPAQNVYNIHGNIIGGVIGGGEVHAKNIAGGDINIGGEKMAATRETFAEQLQKLQELLERAIKSGEFSDARDAETAVEDLQDVVEEIQSDQPRARRLSRRLEDVSETLSNVAAAAESAGKAGAAVLKAAPIAAGLIKLAQMIF